MRRKWFEKQLKPRQRADKEAGDGRRLVARALLLRAAKLWDRQKRDRGRLGGHGELPALGPAAPDPVAPAGPRDDDRVLGEPLQRPRQRRRRSSRGAATTGCIRAHALVVRRPAAGAITHPAMRIYLEQRRRPSRRRTRTSVASCSSAHRRRRGATPRTTSRTPPGSSPATGSPCGRLRGDLQAPGPLERAVTVMGFQRPEQQQDGQELTSSTSTTSPTTPRPPAGSRASCA